MTPRQIEVFRAVVQTGSITAASERLNVSQPAVSKQIQLFEHAAGFPLFERLGNRIKPTTEAMLVFEKIQTVYAGLDQVERLATSIRDNRSGAVTIGSMPLLAHHWLPTVVAGFMAEAEGASLSLPVRSTDWILGAVASGRIDMGLCLADANVASVASVPLMRLPLVCLCRHGHPFEAQKSVAPHQLEAEKFVSLRSFDGVASHALNIPEVHRASSVPLEVFTTAAAGEIVLAGFGVTVVDALTARTFETKGLIGRPVETQVNFDLALFTSPASRKSRLAQFLRDRILELAYSTERDLAARYSLC